MMRIVGNLTLICQSRDCWHCHSFISASSEIHLFKLYPHIDCLANVGLSSCHLSDVIFMDSFLRIIASKVEVLHLQLSNTHDLCLIIEDVHVWTHSIINILLTILLLDYLIEDFFKQILLLLHHIFHLFLRFFLKSKLPLFYFFLYLSLQDRLFPLFFFLLYRLLLLQLLLFLLKFPLLVRRIPICKRFPKVFCFLHERQILLLFFPWCLIFFFLLAIILIFRLRLIRFFLFFLFNLLFYWLLPCWSTGSHRGRNNSSENIELLLIWDHRVY